MTLRTHNTIDQLLENLFATSIGDIIGADVVRNQPAANIFEEEEAFIVELGVPGFAKEDFELAVKEDFLMVSNVVEEDKPRIDQDVRWMRREFDFSEFNRRFRIPENVDRSGISAKYERGILRIQLNKKVVKDVLSKKINIS